MPINDTKWRINYLSQMFNIKLRHNAAVQRMRAQSLNPGNDLSDEPFPYIRHTFTRIKGLQVLKVLDR